MKHLLLLATWFMLPQLPARAMCEESSSVICTMPGDLGDLAFGDPLYVPVSFINLGAKPADVPFLKDHSGTVFFRITCGTSRCKVHWGGGMGGQSVVTLPSGGACTTVMLLNVWTPEFADEFQRLGKATINVTPYGDQTYADAPMQASVALNGNSFKTSVSEILRLFDTAQLNEDWKINEEGQSFSQLDGFKSLSCGTPFWDFMTPLSWETSYRDFDKWTINDSPLVKKGRQVIKPGTRLERLLDISLALQPFRTTYEFEDVLDLMDRPVEIIKGCDRLERQWFIGLLAHQALTNSCCSGEPGAGAHRSEMVDRLLRAFPDASSQFLSTPSFSVLTLSQPYTTAE